MFKKIFLQLFFLCVFFNQNIFATAINDSQTNNSQNKNNSQENNENDDDDEGEEDDLDIDANFKSNEDNYNSFLENLFKAGKEKLLPNFMKKGFITVYSNFNIFSCFFKKSPSGGLNSGIISSISKEGGWYEKLYYNVFFSKLDELKNIFSMSLNIISILSLNIFLSYNNCDISYFLPLWRNIFFQISGGYETKCYLIKKDFLKFEVKKIDEASFMDKNKRDFKNITEAKVKEDYNISKTKELVIISRGVLYNEETMSKISNGSCFLKNSNWLALFGFSFYSNCQNPKQSWLFLNVLIRFSFKYSLKDIIFIDDSNDFIVMMGDENFSKVYRKIILPSFCIGFSVGLGIKKYEILFNIDLFNFGCKGSEEDFDKIEIEGLSSLKPMSIIVKNRLF